MPAVATTTPRVLDLPEASPSTVVTVRRRRRGRRRRRIAD
jgi:hypothetical protein